MVGYSYDSELNSEKVIYTESDPSDYEEGEEIPEVNIDKYEIISVDDFLDAVSHKEEALNRIREVAQSLDPDMQATGEILEESTDRGSDIRLDH
jgi:hypothetical protein